MNSADPEPLKGFEPNLTQVLIVLGRRTDDVLEVIGSKGQGRLCLNLDLVLIATT